MQEILDRYAAEAKVLADHLESVPEYMWKSLLASFAYEIAAYTEAEEVPA